MSSASLSSPASSPLEKNTRSSHSRGAKQQRHGTRTGRSRARRHAQLVAWAFLVPVVVYLAIFYVYPLWNNLDLSLRHYTVRSFISGDAPWVGLGNFASVLASSTFMTALWNTAVFVIVSIIFQFGIGLALAVFFFQRFPLSGTLRALFLVPWLLPLLVSASTWAWMLNSDSGVVNSLLQAVGITPINWLTSPQWSLIAVLIANIWIGIPFNLVILYSGLQSISPDVYEAAMIDGANGWQRFWRITFPLLRPVSAITILLGLVYTLKVFDIIWIMTRGGPSASSTTFAIWSYQLGFGSLLPDFSSAATVGDILILIALAFGLIYVALQRKLENS